MRVPCLLLLAVPIALLGCSHKSPVRNDHPIIRQDYRDADNVIPTDPGAPLFTRLGTKIVAPDGHQVTLAELTKATGTASLWCDSAGTHAELHLTGLIPKGIYTVFNAVPNPESPQNLAIGPVGASDGRDSVFKASASGQADITAVTPPGPLGTRGGMPSCALTDLRALNLECGYHIDGQTYGPNPAPRGRGAAVQIVQLMFEFTFK